MEPVMRIKFGSLLDVVLCLRASGLLESLLILKSQSHPRQEDP